MGKADAPPLGFETIFTAFDEAERVRFAAGKTRGGRRTRTEQQALCDGIGRAFAVGDGFNRGRRAAAKVADGVNIVKVMQRVLIDLGGVFAGQGHGIKLRAKQAEIGSLR